MLHIYSSPKHTIDLAKAYQYAYKVKDIYLYIVKNQLQSLVPVLRRVNTDAILQ